MSAKLKNIITMFTVVVLILGISVGLSVILKPIKDRNLNRDVINKYQQVFEQKVSNVVDKEMKDSDPKTVVEAKTVYAGNTVIGSAYEATKPNIYGDVTLIVSVNKDNEILGIVANLVQTENVANNKKYIESFRGSKITDVKSVDGQSAPSQGFTQATATELLADIATVHGAEPIVVIEKNVYELLFGDDYAFSDEVLIDSGDIKRSQTVSGSLGSALVYYLEGFGEKIGGDSESFEIQLIVDPYTTKVLGYYLDKAKYHHTPGGYQDNVEGFLGKVLEANTLALSFKFEDIEIDGDSGVSNGGIFNSVELAQRMLTDLSTYLQDIYIIEDIVVITNENVLSSQKVTINNKVFMIYEITATGLYDGYNGKSDLITSRVVLNDENIIVAMSFIEYKHTPTANFKDPSDKYIKYLVVNETNITTIEPTEQLELDGSSGASKDTNTNPSNSVKVIHDSLVGLSEYIKGGN